MRRNNLLSEFTPIGLIVIVSTLVFLIGVILVIILVVV